MTAEVLVNVANIYFMHHRAVLRCPVLVRTRVPMAELEHRPAPTAPRPFCVRPRISEVRSDR